MNPEDCPVSEAHPFDHRLTRRIFAASGAAVMGLAAVQASASASRARKSMPAQSCFAYVGCRTSRERKAQGDGIAVYRVEARKTEWKKIQLVGDLINPSYLLLDSTKRTLYALHGDTSDISAFRVDPQTGQLKFLNRQSTHGKNPVHLTLDPTGKFVVIANHVATPDMASGLAVLAIEADGSLGALTDLVAFAGKVGPHRVEQPFPKPHQVRYDPAKRYIVVPDKGRDLVEAYSLSAEGKLSLSTIPAPHAQEGAGPRHVAFHPRRPFAYVVNELNSTLVAYRFDPATGGLTPFQVLSALPDTWVGDSRGSEIEVSDDGRFIYASNRGNDTIAVFAIDQATGRMSPTGWTGCHGKTPRFFAFSPVGHTLFVANEESHSVEAFNINTKKGGLSHAGTAAKTGSPTCIVFSA